MGGLRLGRVAQVAVTVLDLDRAVGFYRDVLGLPLQLQAPRLAILDCAGMRLMLTLPEGEFTNNASVLYFDTDAIEDAHAALRAAGAAVEGDPHKVADFGGRELWMAFFRDSEGNVMALVEERVPAAAR